MTIGKRDATQVAEVNLSISEIREMKKEIRSCLRSLKKDWLDCYDCLQNGCLMFDIEALDLAAELLKKEREDGKAHNLYYISALFGSVNAMFHIGEFLMMAGEEKDGIEFIQNGAEEGDVRCMLLLIVCYGLGWFVKKDKSISEKWAKEVNELDPYGYEYVRLMAESQILNRVGNNNLLKNAKKN